MFQHENIFYGIESSVEDKIEHFDKMAVISDTENKYKISNLFIDLILSSKIKEKLSLCLKYYSYVIYDKILEIKNMFKYQFNDLWTIIFLHPDNSYKNWWKDYLPYRPDSFGILVKNDTNSVWTLIERIKNNENKGNPLIRSIKNADYYENIAIKILYIVVKMNYLSI